MRLRRGSRLRGSRSLPYYTPPMCPRCALYASRNFSRWGNRYFSSYRPSFSRGLVIAAHVQPSTFFPFSLSCIRFFFFSTFSVSTSCFSVTKTICCSRSTCVDAQFPSRAFFFKLLEIEEGGGGTNDRGYRNIFERGI